ncbi:hypothetical protein PENSPDRAFT_655036 [Peniophora sp. CONT]|nr:hypothetical protein PENSPDRAFT_655036 [Peniophora sp. CONT]
MASYETILEVMASALHQRRVWGLAETLVLGLAFHPHSTRLQMFWGWFEDPGTGEDTCMPVPQVAFRATPLCARATSLFDSYDLADGASALVLAQVLFSLHSHFLSLRLAGNNTLCPGIAHGEPPVWRADAHMIRIDQPTLLVRINSWLKSMEVPTPSVLAPFSSSPSSPSSPSSSSPTSSSTSPLSGKNKKAEKASTATPNPSVQGGGLKGSPRSGPSRGTRSHDSSSALLEVPQSTLFNAPSVAESRRSASTFSHPQSNDSYHKVYYWCLWRAVLMHTMNGPPGDDSDERPWYPALHKYYALAKPDYALSAHGKEASRTASHSGSYDQLIELLKSGHQDTGDLTERCVLALAPTILLVVELAKGLRSAAQYLGNSLVPESSWRCIWDFLTAIVLIQLEILEKSEENAEVVDMLEQNMRLPHADKGLVGLSDGRAAEYNLRIYGALTKELNTVEGALEAATPAMPGDTQRLRTLLKQAACASQYHGQAFFTWSEYCRGIPTCDHKEAPMRARVDGAWALVLKDVFDEEPMSSYLRDNPHFLPLDISPSIFRFQSHAPEYVRSFLHRSNVLEKDPKDLSGAQKLHFMTDTMIGGVLGPASPADRDEHLARRMLREAHNFDRVITEARKAGTGGKLPRVPLPSDLLVPFFIREYKRLLDHPKDSGVTQCRMALVAATKFLGKLGVTLCPTYGLVTEGDLGSVHMAIGVPKKSFLKLTPTVDEDISVHVFERGCNMFQLSTEEGAIAYVAFLVGLHTTARTDLATKLHDVKDHLRQRLRKDPASPHLSWSMQQHPDVIQEEERKAKQKAKSAPVLADSVDVEDDTIQPSDIGL